MDLADVIPRFDGMRCNKCSMDADYTLSYDYAEAKVWIDDGLDAPGYSLCPDHADRFTPPVGWVLVDRRAGASPVITLEVA